MASDKEPQGLNKISLASLNLRTEQEAHEKARKLLKGTMLKARIRTLLPKEN